MKLRQVGGKRKWRIVAPVDVVNGVEVCTFADDLRAFEDNRMTSSAALGLDVIWGRVGDVGPKGLGTDLYHLIDPEHGIYEFIKGRLRVVCFEAPNGAICVCSCVFMKKTQMAPRSHIRAAIALKKKVIAALEKNLLEIVQA